MATDARQSGLAGEAIGLREVLFQSITHMAPAVAVAFGGHAMGGIHTRLREAGQAYVAERR